MAEKKVTKKENYKTLKEIVESADGVDNKEALIEFIDSQIAAIDMKAAKNQEAVEKKRAEGDEHRAAVYAVLTEGLQTIDEIMSQVNGITKAMVVARLTQLIKLNKVVKEMIKMDGGRRISAYRLAEADFE